MRHKKLMKRILLLLLFVFLMSLFTSTFVSALQESDDNSDESTTVSLRQRRGRCPYIKDSLVNGWVRTRNRGRIAKFFCNNGFQLVGNRMSTCIQGKWNNPTPVCASRGCKKSIESNFYNTTAIIKGILIEMRCDHFHHWFAGHFSSLKVYCNGSHWKLLGSDEDLDTTSDRYVCKQSTESHFITSEEISTISSLKGAVTAKSETTTNSKFNSKMPEMTPMSKNSVININALTTERTSLSADNSKTPITEPIDKSYTSPNTTNIIQEVSTLTTTTTIRLNTLQTQILSTETTPKMDFTTLSPKHTNYSTKTPFTDNSVTTVTPTPNLTGSSFSESPLKSTPFSRILTPGSLKSTTVPITSTAGSLKSTTVPMTTTAVPLKSTAVPMTSTTSLKSTTIGRTSTLNDLKSSAVPMSLTPTTVIPSKEAIELLGTSVSIPTVGIKKWKMSTKSLNTQYSKTNTVNELSKDPITSSTPSTISTWSVQNSTNPIIKSEINGSTSTTTSLLPNVLSKSTIRVSSGNQSKEPEVKLRSTTTKKNFKTTPEMRVTTALSPQIERNSSKISENKMTTIPIERQPLISTTRQSFSLPSNDSMKYSLSAENTTITPMRRRRQFTTKTSLVVTSTASELKENNTIRGLSISVAVISMTILVAILSLYLIKKRTKTHQNRLSDDSEMLYLSSNEVFQ